MRDWHFTMNDALIGVLDSDSERWPLLTRASRDIVMAHSPKVEWLIDAQEKCNLGHMHSVRTTAFNYTSIFRERLYIGDDKKKSLAFLLDRIETKFRSGERSITLDRHYPRSECGGVFDLIGRWPTKSDLLALCVLRPLTLIDRADGSSEWLIECSLRAIRRDNAA